MKKIIPLMGSAAVLLGGWQCAVAEDADAAIEEVVVTGSYLKRSSENSPSPLEFYGRTFSASGNSATNILASYESIFTNFSFYLGKVTY